MGDTENEIRSGSSGFDHLKGFLSLHCSIYVMLAMIMLVIALLWLWTLCTNHLFPRVRADLKRPSRWQRVYKAEEAVPVSKVKSTEGNNIV